MVKGSTVGLLSKVGPCQPTDKHRVGPNWMGIINGFSPRVMLTGPHQLILYFCHITEPQTLHLSCRPHTMNDVPAFAFITGNAVQEESGIVLNSKWWRSCRHIGPLKRVGERNHKKHKRPGSSKGTCREHRESKGGTPLDRRVPHNIWVTVEWAPLPRSNI